MTDIPPDNHLDVNWAYVGAYTRREPHVEGKSAGISALRFDRTAGALTLMHTTTGVVNPSYLALHPDGKALYSISEVSEFNGRPTGAVYAYAIDAQTHALIELNQRSVKGPGPAYISIDSAGKNALIANYGGGSLCVLPILPDLSLGAPTDFIQHEGSSVHPQRQAEPHAHSVVLDASGAYALAADLGMDKLMIYRYNAEVGALKPNPEQPWARTKSGAGPRHIAQHPNQRYIYVINELDSTIVVSQFEGAKGVMTELQTISTLPADYQGRSHCADIHVHPSGRWLYGSNRGHDSIAVYDIDTETGLLSNYRFVASGGEVPRGFAVDPSGAYVLVANQNSDNIVVFSVNQHTGDLAPVSETQVMTPVCIKLLAR